jgi:glycosyltransferase involved in cell wall biosynthesis
MSESHALHIGLELLRSTGGTTKAVADFAAALPGTILSLCSPAKLKKEGPYRADWRYAGLSRGWRGRSYEYVDSAELRNALAHAPKPSAVFCHMLYRYNTNIARGEAMRHGVNYYAVPHGCLDPWVFTYRGWQKKMWLNLYGKRFLHGAKKVVFATEGESKKAQRITSLDNSVVINWPVDLPRDFRGERATVRRKYFLPTDGRILLSFGRLHSMKRPLELIELFAGLNRLDATLVVVGPEDNVKRQECEAVAAGAKNVRILPGIYGDELAMLIQACDGYISWSARENFNYCLAESMAAGLAVLAGPGNDLACDLAHSGCGWFPRRDDGDTMARCIVEFLEASGDRLREMGKNAAGYSAKNFSREMFHRRVERLVAGD